MYENNAMYNNNFYGGAYGMPGGMMYAQNYQRPQMTQPLTPEEMNILADKGGAFSTKVTQEDMLKAYCTHKKNGAIVIMQNPDGSLTCPICGETFDQTSLEKADIEADVKKVIDDIQNIKLTYLDIGTEVARQYFPIIPLLAKLPQLAVMASNNFAKYEQGSAMINGGNSPYGFAQFNNLMNGGMMYGQPQMMYPQPQPMYQQPMGFGQQIPAQQPMMYGQMPMAGGYAPMTNNYDPNQMINPMNTGAYPAQMPPQAGMMMPQAQATTASNEFGTFGNPAYAPQPQPAAQTAVAPNPVIPPAQTTAPTAPQAGTPSVDVTSFTL